MPRLLLAVTLCLGLLAHACTNADLYIPLDPDSPSLRAELSARVCGPPPFEVDTPHKILFVIDKSLSNVATDPDERRVDAYYEAIDRFLAYPSVEFAVLLFNDRAHQPTLAFTRDRAILEAVGKTLTNDVAEGGTNYEDSIQTIRDFIAADITATANARTLRETHYLVYWLSDGLPTFGLADRYTLVSNIRVIAEFLRDRVAEFRLDTLFMEPPTDHPTFHVDPSDVLEAQTLLEEMADAGGGSFTNITTGTSFDFDIEVETTLKFVEFAAAVANNRHVRFGSEFPRPDSDGDGIVDREERDLELDPQRADTDGDGFSDGFELRTTFLLNPHVPDAGCESGASDLDGDLLPDCEERMLGTDAQLPDTDGDGILDREEFLFESSPLSADRTADKDIDGMSDWSEVASHLDPSLENTIDDQRRWGYRYQYVEVIDNQSNRPCYDITVENIALSETLLTGDHPRGGQVIDLTVALQSNDENAARFFYRAQTRVGYRWPDIREPVDGRIELAPEDFVEISPAD